MLKLAPLAAIPVAVAATLLASHLAMGHAPGNDPGRSAAQAAAVAAWADPPARPADARPAPRVIPIVETGPYRPSPVKVTLRMPDPEPAATVAASRKAEPAKPRRAAHATRRRTMPTQPQAEPAVASAPVAQPTRVASSGPLGDILKGLGLAD